MLSITLKCNLLILYRFHCKDGKNWLGKRKKVEQYYEDRYDKIQDYKFKRASSADFYRRASEPITNKNEKQKKKLGEKIYEQTEKQLASMPD